MHCSGSLRIAKTLQKPLRKLAEFIAKITLLNINCFSTFPSCDASLKDESRSGCLSSHDQDALRGLVECNPRKTTRELETNLNTFQSIICSNLKKTYTKKEYENLLRKLPALGNWRNVVLLLHNGKPPSVRIFTIKITIQTPWLIINSCS